MSMSEDPETADSPMPSSPVPLESSASNPQIAAELQSHAKILALIQRTGYKIVQENGQRRYGGPPPDWPEDQLVPSRGCEVFVGKIPRDCYEDELVPLFETVGQIYELRLMMNFGGENRGYAFVMFTSKQEAQRAIHDLNNYEIRKGKYIGVCLSVDNCRLFIGGIPKTKTRDETLEEMKKITSGVVDVIMYPSVMDKTKNRGFAFVEYESHKAAAMARRKMIPGKILLWNQQVAVDWAEPERSVDDDTMSKVKILYIRNLMMSTTEQQIEQMLTNYLQKPKAIERVKKINDYAFVHFAERADALACLEQFNNSVLENTTIEVSLAKPPDKAAQKQQQQQQQQQHPQHNGSPVKMMGALDYSGFPLLTFHPQMPLLNAAAIQPFGVRGPGTAPLNVGKFHPSWKGAPHQPQQQHQQQMGARGYNRFSQHQLGGNQQSPHPQFGVHSPSATQQYFDPSSLMMPSLYSGSESNGLLQQTKPMNDITNKSTTGPQQPSQVSTSNSNQSHSPGQDQPFSTSPSVKMAYQVLDEFCMMNGIPMPAYTFYWQYLPAPVLMTPSSSTSSVDGGANNNGSGDDLQSAGVEAGSKQDVGSGAKGDKPIPVAVSAMYICVVTIHGVLTVTSPRYCVDETEAKNLAALVALTQMGANPAGLLTPPACLELGDQSLPSPPMSSAASSLEAAAACSPPDLSMLSVIDKTATNPSCLIGSGGSSVNGSNDSIYAYLASSTNRILSSSASNSSSATLHHHNQTTAAAAADSPPYLLGNNWVFSAPDGYALFPGGIVPMSPVPTSLAVRGAGTANAQTGPYQIFSFPQASQNPVTSATPATQVNSGMVQ